MVSTLLPGLKPSVVEKTLKVMAERIAPAEARHDRLRHARAAPKPSRSPRPSARPAASPAEIVVVFGASAITDRRDVVPQALVEAGGACRASRHAGRSRQSAADRRAWRQAA